MADMNYDQIYADWEQLPNDKSNQIVPGENIWVKVLPSGDLALNNNPLDERFRWQDVIRNGKIIHRRWNTKVPYMYQGDEDKEKDLAIRQRLFAALEPLGRPGFFCSGRGHLLLESDDAEACRHQVVDVLETLGIENNVAPLWHIKGESPPEEEN